MAADETKDSKVDKAARMCLRGLAAGERLYPMLRHLLMDALVSESRSDRPHDPNSLASDAARAATAWIGATPEERGKVLQELLGLADALPPQPKHGPSLPDKVSSVHAALNEAHVAHAFGGALAVAYYGEPRATGDIDLNVFVSADDCPEIRASLASLGVDTETDGRELKQFHELRLDWGLTPIHLFFSCDPLHAQMRQAVRSVPFNGDVIPLIAAEHLVVRKAFLDRPKDWHDIEQILVATSPLNLEEIEEWLRQLIGADDQRMEKLREVKISLSLH
jgi:hypothetical protein